MLITGTTIVAYEYTGDTRELTIPFEYLKRDFVFVYLRGDGKPQKLLSNGIDYKFATKTTIVITRPYQPDEGYNKVIIRRVTDTSKRIINYQDGSILNASELNTSQLQALHVAEEARDLPSYTIGINNRGDLDARGSKIVNVGYGTEKTDCATIGNLLDAIEAIECGSFVYFETIADLRKYEPKVINQFVIVRSYFKGNDNGGGIFYYDSSDLETADDGGSCIIVNNKRWKRLFNDSVSILEFGADSRGLKSSTTSIMNASRFVGQGGTLRVPSGTYLIDETINIEALSLIGDGQGSTILKFTNRGDGIVFNMVTKPDIEFGCSNLTIIKKNVNGGNCIVTPKGSTLNSLYPKPTFEHLSFNSGNIVTFKQDYSWENIFNLGDSWCLTLRAIDAQGVYDAGTLSSEQFIDTFIRFEPLQGILSCRISNITTHNIATFIDLKQKTYFSLSDVDIAKSHIGIKDSTDRVYESNKYAYGESVWNNVIISSSKCCIDLTNRYDLMASGLILHRPLESPEEGWIGLKLVSSRSTSLSNMEIGSGVSSNSVGILIDGGDSNKLSNITFGTLETCLQIGVYGRNASQALSVNNVSLAANVSTVLDVQNSRSLLFNSFNKSSGFKYTTFAKFKDAASKTSSYLMQCPEITSFNFKSDVYFIDESKGLNAKRLRFNMDSGLNMATQLDSGSVGDNFFIAKREQSKIKHIELRTEAKPSNYIQLNAPEVHISGLMKPSRDNSYSLGNQYYRWSEVFSVKGVNQTSDARLKANIRAIDDRVLDAWEAMDITQYNWLDDFIVRGPNAVINIGVIAQDIKDHFDKFNLNALDYGVLSYAQWGDTEAEYDDDGVMVREARETGDIFYINPVQCLFLESAVTRRRLRRIEEHIRATN